MTAAPPTGRTWPRELLVLRRDRGYLRVHVPPLLYTPSLPSKLEKALSGLAGVRRVAADRHAARLSVFYDPWLTDDRPLLVAVDAAARPSLGKMTPEAFDAALGEQDEARRERLVGKAAQGGYLALLGWAHWHVLRWALRNPVGAWWVWALLGFGVYTHRRQIRQIPRLSP
jgi:hypothetical protein